MAKTMTLVLTPDDSESAPKRPRKLVMISLAHASVMRDRIVAIAPPMMNGRLLPHEMRQLSLFIPTYGWTSAPDSGPAIQTSASIDLLNPRDKRYG